MACLADQAVARRVLGCLPAGLTDRELLRNAGLAFYRIDLELIVFHLGPGFSAKVE
ncbi:MAG: hypothetical protein ACP5R5_12430 [Armatimonadota bacterium]